MYAITLGRIPTMQTRANRSRATRYCERMPPNRPQVPPRRWVWAVLVFAVVVMLALLCLVGFAADTGNHGEGVIIGATIGTALGTLALAGTTYALARATRETVREAGAELAELKEQGKLVAEQARIAGEQAAATARLADASKAGAEAAEKSRVDAIAPMVECVVSLAGVEVTNRERQNQPFGADVTWYVPQLDDLRFAVRVKFVLTNVGRGPARVTFGDTSTFLERVRAEGLYAVTLAPGGTFIDIYVVNFTGAKAVEGEYVKMPFTYEGIMHGDMFDRIQWNGWVTPLIEQSPGVAKQSDRIVNASGAQVIREYPNLERPEEMKKVRAHLIS